MPEEPPPHTHTHLYHHLHNPNPPLHPQNDDIKMHEIEDTPHHLLQFLLFIAPLFVMYENLAKPCLHWFQNSFNQVFKVATQQLQKNNSC